jgi:hypothetical protein
MIVYPYLGSKNKAQSGGRLAFYTSSFMLFYCMAFALLAMGCQRIELKSYGIVELFYERVAEGTQVMDWTIILSQMAQIPFKFYLGKEFVFILIDELRNKSISTKMDHLKTFLGNKKLYSETMIKRVQDDIYQVVRMPYMRYSNTQYYSISIAIYFFNLGIVVLLRSFYQGGDYDKLNPVQYIVSLTAAGVQPLIVYTLSGFLYYRTCL